MRAYLLVVCLGVFCVMALSNAIVPVLPAFATGSAWEGAIYAAYFLGAFISTLPGGFLSDRYGRTPVIRTGLMLTVISGILLYYTSGPLPVITLRLLEGLGAGLFIAAGMSYVNSQPDHTRMSGYYLAMLNIGLVSGLVASGWLAGTVYAACSWDWIICCTFIGSTGRGYFYPRDPGTNLPAGYPDSKTCRVLQTGS